MTAGKRLSLIVVALLVLSALLAPLIAPYDPAAQLDLLRLKNALPSPQHWLGTDAFSRDTLSRLLFGARASLTVAAIGSVVATLLGAVWGATAGWCGGTIDSVMMTIAQVIRSVPRLLLMLSAFVLLGAVSPVPLALLLGATLWPATAALAHQQVRALRSQPFLEASLALGAASRQTLARHVAPHLRAPLLASAALLVADLMALEAGLSFVGLGLRPPHASWGNMVQDALPFLQSAWWVAAVPCTALVVSVLAVSTLANGSGTRGASWPNTRPDA